MENVLEQMIADCLANHRLCNEFYQEFEDPLLATFYNGNNILIKTILGASLPSPDGNEWSEFHHIGGRAHSDTGRLISRELHNAIHAGHAPEISPPKVKFHCLEPGREWAGAYLNGSFVPKPSKPIQILWDLKLQDAKHRLNGSQASSAVSQIEEFVINSIKDYIYEVRVASWDKSGLLIKYNISPGESPAYTRSWAEDIKNQIKSWYNLGPAQKQHINHIASIYGHLGTKLLMNGFEFNEIQELVSTHRMAQTIYRIANVIYQSDEDAELLADKLKQDLLETVSLSDDQRAKELISRWIPTTQRDTIEPVNITRQSFFNNNNIFIVTSLPFSEEELQRINEISSAREISFDLLQLINDNI